MCSTRRLHCAGSTVAGHLKTIGGLGLLPLHIDGSKFHAVGGKLQAGFASGIGEYNAVADCRTKVIRSQAHPLRTRVHLTKGAGERADMLFVQIDNVAYSVVGVIGVGAVDGVGSPATTGVV